MKTMTRLIGVAVAFAMVAAIVFPAAVQAAPQTTKVQTKKVRVAIMDFANRSSFNYFGDFLGPAAASELATQLVKSGAFTVIERDRLDAILAEQGLGQAGTVNAATAAQVGKLLGAQLILTGDITQFSLEEVSGGFRGIGGSYHKAEVKLDVRMIDTNTGELLLAEEGEGTKNFGGAFVRGFDLQRDFNRGVAQEALRPAVDDLVGKVVSQADRFANLETPAASGNIVGEGEDNTVYIDRGSNFEVQVGDRFAAYRVVDEIKDAHGNVLDRVTERVGTIEVTRVLSQSSICTIVEGEAAEGDTFRPVAG